MFKIIIDFSLSLEMTMNSLICHAEPAYREVGDSEASFYQNIILCLQPHAL